MLSRRRSRPWHRRQLDRAEQEQEIAERKQTGFARCFPERPKTVLPPALGYGTDYVFVLPTAWSSTTQTNSQEICKKAVQKMLPGGFSHFVYHPPQQPRPPIMAYFSSTYSKRAWRPPSRPRPLSLTPPKGISAMESVLSLMATIPY